MMSQIRGFQIGKKERKRVCEDAEIRDLRRYVRSSRSSDGGVSGLWWAGREGLSGSTGVKDRIYWWSVEDSVEQSNDVNWRWPCLAAGRVKIVAGL